MWGEREKSPKERSSEAGRTLDTDQGRITSTSLIFSLTNLLENLQDVSLEPIKPIKNHISPGAGIPRGGCSSFLLPWSQESTTRPLDFVFYLQTRGFCIFKCVKQDEKTGINITESHQSIHIIIKKIPWPAINQPYMAWFWSPWTQLGNPTRPSVKKENTWSQVHTVAHPSP